MGLIQSARQYLGVFATNPPGVVPAKRAPTASDKAYRLGWLWVNTITDNIYGFTGDTWVILGGAAGAVATINSLAPTAGNIIIAGTANQITVTSAVSTITLSLPAAITAPGSLTTTTTLAAGTTVTAGTGITSTTGAITATAGAVVAGTTVTAGTGITSTTGAITATAGAVNAGTSITATAGDITATLGHIIVNGAAKQFQCHGGAVTDFIGQCTLATGTVTVANTNIAATDRIYVTRASKNGSTAYGSYESTITPATNFVITACKADTTTETGDTSILNYIIVRQV